MFNDHQVINLSYIGIFVKLTTLSIHTYIRMYVERERERNDEKINFVFSDEGFMVDKKDFRIFL